MFDTITVIAYLLGNEPGHSGHMRLHVEKQAQVCMQKTQSPWLRWSGAPPEASSLALIIKDEKPQKESGKTEYYWIAYNLPVDVKNLPNDTNDQMSHNDEGVNSWGQKSYHAPCWANATHPVVVELYALDKRFDAREKMTGDTVEQKIKGHILAKTKVEINQS